MLDFFKTPVERPEAVVAAGKGNVADRGICSFQKMSAEIDPVLVYQIRKGKVQMAVDKSGDIHPVVPQVDCQILKGQFLQIMFLDIDQDLMEQIGGRGLSGGKAGHIQEQGGNII